MRSSRAVAPRAEPTRIGSVAGVEVWRLFDWYEPQRYYSPDFVFTTPAAHSDGAVSYRFDGSQTSINSGLLMTLPDRVLNIDDVGGGSAHAEHPMLISLVVPISVLSEAERQRLERTSLDPGLSGPAWGQALRDLIASVEEKDASPCEKEEEVRGFVLRALVAACPDIVGPQPTSCRRSVRRVKEYIHTKFADTFSLEDIAHEVDITKWHLARSFQKEVGLSIGQYLRQVRAHHSLRMLRTGAKLTLVAAELGYSDQAHLTRELRQRFGFTPGQYVRANVLPRRVVPRTDR